MEGNAPFAHRLCILAVVFGTRRDVCCNEADVGKAPV